MRHNKKFNHLSRKTAHRSAMLANMACSLLEHKRINTTLAKAKALRKFVEPVMTKSKQDTTHNRRLTFKVLRSKEAVTELFREVSNKIADRPGGYTRIIRLGNRLGDNAEMAMIELVDYNEIYSGSEKIKKTTTRRGRAKKKTETVATDVTKTVQVTDTAKQDSAKDKPAKRTATKPKANAETKAKTETKVVAKPKKTETKKPKEDNDSATKE